MKKLGVALLIIGVAIMSFAAYKFIRERKMGSEEQVQKEPTPFPWLPTSGALLTAAGIIMMGSGRYKRVR